MKRFFDEVGSKTRVKHGEASFELPILYFREDSFAAFFPANREKVRALLPCQSLEPVALTKGKTVVGIAAFNYLETTVGSYGEVAVVVPVVHKGKSVPAMPLLLEARYPGFGMLVLHLPVTDVVPRDAGRGEWGYTKFVADMDFTITPEFLQCRLSEEDSHILTLRVPRRGVAKREKKPIVTYSVKEGKLVKTTIPQRGLYLLNPGPWGAKLELGEHPVAQSIKELGISPKPILTRAYLYRSAILPAGEVVEEGVNPLEGYKGTDRKGRHTVRYLED
jgi:hypothetical protein